MDHGYFKDRISAFYDRSLKPEEQAVVEEHLRECEECRKLLDDFKKLDALVEKHNGLDGEDYWEESARRIESQLGGEEGTEVTEVSRSGRWGLAWKLIAVAASVALLTVVGLHRDDIWEQTGPEKEEITAPYTVTPAEIDDTERAKGAERDLGAVTDEIQKEEELADVKDIADDNYRTPDAEEVMSPTTSPSVPEKAEPSSPVPGRMVEATRDASHKVKRAGESVRKEKPVATQETEVVSKNERVTYDAPGKVTADQDFEGADKIQPQALAEVEPDTVLAELRSQKDSLQGLMSKDKLWDTSELNSSLTEKKTMTNLVPPTKPSSADIENELIQVCFKIGMLTEDEKEFTEVRDIIEKVTKDPESSNRKLAESYLQQFDDR